MQLSVEHERSHIVFMQPISSFIALLTKASWLSCRPSTSWSLLTNVSQHQVAVLQDFTSTSIGQGSSVSKTLRQPSDGPFKETTPIAPWGRNMIGTPICGWWHHLVLNLLGLFQAGKHPRKLVFRGVPKTHQGVFQHDLQGVQSPIPPIRPMYLYSLAPRDLIFIHYFWNTLSPKVPS